METDRTGEKPPKKAKVQNEEVDRMGAIWSNMKTTIQNHISYERKKKGMNYGEMLQRFIMMPPPSTPGKQTIEIRFGLIDGEAFRPGLRKADYDHLLNSMDRLLGEPRTPPEFEQFTDYHFHHPEGSLRITHDEREKQCRRAYMRHFHRKEDVEYSRGSYDAQLTSLTEIEYDTPQRLPDGWTTRWESLRWRYYRSCWTIDLLQESGQTTREKRGTSFHLTVRVAGNELAKLRADATGAERESAALWEWLGTLFDALQRAKLWDAGKLWTVLPVDRTHGEEQQALRLSLREALGLSGNIEEVDEETLRSFPGPQAQPLSRRDMEALQQKKFFASSSAQGIRALLFITAEGVYLVNRQFNFHFVHNSESLVRIFGQEGPTLTDGEIVRHMTSDSPMYIVSDMWMLRGEPLRSLPLSERLKKIGEGLIVPYRQALASKEIPTPQPFTLTGKLYQDKAKIRHIFEFIQEENGERFFKDNRRHHQCTGITFSADVPFEPFAKDTHLQWKYLDTLTLDLQVTYLDHQKRMIFTCAGGEGHDVEYKVSMPNEDWRHFRRDLERHQFQREQKEHEHLVVQFSYLPFAGLWHYKRFKGKAQPDPVKKVFETLETISENISQEELQFRLPLSPDKDNWTKVLQGCHDKLLQSQQS